MEKKNLEVDIKKLQEAIDVAEKVLVDMEEDNDGKSKRKKKRVNKALSHAFETLDKEEYSEKEVEKRTDEIWKSLMDDDHFLVLIIFFFGFALSGTIIFTVFQAYSFIQVNWDPKREQTVLTENTSDLIKIDYIENQIVNLYDQMTVPDKVGLNNKPQKFTIKNDSTKVGNINYLVHYSVRLVPMNEPDIRLIDKKFIKYKYSYKDSETGKTFESSIGTIEDLTELQDGSLLLTKGVQKRDSETDFEVIFWISSLAGNDQQGLTYSFAFDVKAAVSRS